MSELAIDASSTALVLIDLQRGIATGNLAPNAAPDVIARGAELAAAFRKGGALVVLVHVDPGPNGMLFPRPQADNPRPPFNAPPDFSDLVPELDRQPSDVVVTKHQPNAFYCTDIEVHLRRRNITTIVLAGIATNLGVESTARAAFERGYEQIFVADAMSARAEVLHTHTVTHILPTMGRVRSTAEVLSAMA
ncbi:MAG: isochorismatase family protein [Gemmatimonadaceae bacterium]